MSEEQIDTKEIRGVSLRNLIAVIACTGTIMLTVLGTYYGLKADITDVKVSKDSDARLNELKMRVMDQRIDAMEIQIRDIVKKHDDDQRK